MPEHNAQMLQYAASMDGELAAAQRTAALMEHFPQIFGPMHMSDGACVSG